MNKIMKRMRMKKLKTPLKMLEVHLKVNKKIKILTNNLVKNSKSKLLIHFCNNGCNSPWHQLNSNRINSRKPICKELRTDYWILIQPIFINKRFIWKVLHFNFQIVDAYLNQLWKWLDICWHLLLFVCLDLCWLKTMVPKDYLIVSTSKV